MGKSIVINGADFSQVSVPVEKMLSGVIVVFVSNGPARVRGDNEYQRSTLLVNDKQANNTKWGIDTSSDYSDKAKYLLNSLELGHSRIKITYAGVIISAALYDESYNGLYLAPWSGSDGIIEIDLTQYPSAVYFSVNIQSEEAVLSNILIEYFDS